MRVIALDPGKTTGYASYDTFTGAFFSAEYEPTALFRRLDCALWTAEGDGPRPVLVVERFTITAKTAEKSAQPDALHVIGAIKYLQASGQVVMSPTSRKKYGSNAKLKTLGWFKGGAGHADDAARHLLAYLSTVPEGAPLLERLCA